MIHKKKSCPKKNTSIIILDPKESKISITENEINQLFNSAYKKVYKKGSVTIISDDKVIITGNEINQLFNSAYKKVVNHV